MAKKIIVTGCNGQLGRAFNQQLAGNAEYEFVNTDVGELDITDIDAVLKLAREVKPYAIVNCAAATNVDGCETAVDLAYRINAIGPRNLSIAATEVGAKMMQISTDYVFDGHGTRPYTEFDRPDPQSVYGSSKLAGENFVKDFAKDYYIIRTAWLYGEGKNFARTMLRLAQNHDTITVVNDQVGSPTSAAELAKCMAYLLPTENYGLFHGTCEGDCAWSDFAAEVLRLAGSKTVIKPISTEEYGSATNRPAYSILDNYMLRLTGDFMFADWHDAIAAYAKTDAFSPF